MSILHWTPEALARVSSFRRAPTLAPFDVQEAWARLRAEPLPADVVESSPELSAAHAALRAALAQESLPNELDVDAFAIWIRLRPGAPQEVARFGCERLGVEPMIDVWIRTREIAIGWQRQRPTRALSIVAPTSPAPLASALRVPLLNAEPKVRAWVRTKLEPLVALGEVPLLAGAVTLFPEEIDWARALAATYLAAPAQAQGFVVVDALHRSACPLEEVRAVTLAAEGSGGEYETLLDTHGSDALPLLMELLDRLKDSAHQQESIARALTIARSPEVAAKLAEHVGKKKVRRHVDAYFQRFPELAEDALRLVSKRKGRAASMAAEMLAQLARSTSSGTSDEALIEVPFEALPSVLASPPWRGGARKKRKPLVSNALRELRLDGTRAWHGAQVAHSGSAPVGWSVMDDAEAAAWLEGVLRGEWASSRGDATNRLAVPDAVQLAAWERGCFSHEHSGTLRTMLEVHGMAAASGALAWARRHLPRSEHPFQLAPFADLELQELAPEMAMALERRVTSELALRWLRRFSTTAIAGLLAVAVGELGARRTAAERAVRLLAREGVDVRARANELVKTSFAENPLDDVLAKDVIDKTSSALDEVLGWDPLSDCPGKPPKLSARYRPEGLFRPTLRDGRALPLEALRHLDEMLAFTPTDPPYAGIELVREACDPRSLAEHAWSLARAWEASGARKTDDWMLRSLVHLADDEVVRRMTPTLKNKLVIDVLVAIGTDAAAMELATIGARGGSGQLRELAESALDRLAEARGVARDRLDEQLTPTLGLDSRGGLELDYGPRRFRVVFDEHLVPNVRADDGKASPTLPRSRKGDDPAKVEAARAIWDELREDIAAIARVRIQALERAMLADATWSVEELESAWTKHPLMAHLARRMVFVAMREGDAPVTFRVAEDGTYVGAMHETVTLDPDARVGVPHPLRWPDDSLSAWMQMLADYEIVQPFPQLARTVPFVDEAWLVGARIKLSLSDPGDGFARRRRLANCGWNVAVHPNRLEIGDGLFVTATSSAFSRGGVLTQESELICRRGTEEAPWGEVPRTTLLRVLDAFA